MEKLNQIVVTTKIQWIRSAVLSMLTTTICITALSLGESALMLLTVWLQCRYHELKDAGESTIGLLVKSAFAVIVMRFFESVKTLPPVVAAFYLFRDISETKTKSNYAWFFGAWGLSLIIQLGMGVWDIYRRTHNVANSTFPILFLF